MAYEHINLQGRVVLVNPTGISAVIYLLGSILNFGFQHSSKLRHIRNKEFSPGV